MQEEIKTLVHKIAGLVCEARVLCEELEMDAREDDVEDEHLEAEAYDWSCGLEAVETRVDELIAEYFPEDNDESNA